MKLQEAKKYMKEKWFLFVYEWEDSPWTIYEEHFHQGKTALFTLSGSIEFYFSENWDKKLIQAWEYFEIEALKKHSAKVGKNGWEVVVGEMIEGDS